MAKRISLAVFVFTSIFVSGSALADVRPDVKVYEEPGWCVWCPSPVAVPEGTSATVVMPSGKKHEISPGAHTVKEQEKQETVSDSILPFMESAI